MGACFCFEETNKNASKDINPQETSNKKIENIESTNHEEPQQSDEKTSDKEKETLLLNKSLYFTVTTQQQTELNIPSNISTLPDFFGEGESIEMQPLIQYFEDGKWDRMDEDQNSKLLNVIKKLQHINQGNTENKENLNAEDSEQIYEYLVDIVERRLQENVLDFGAANTWNQLTVQHLWEIGDIVTFFGEYIYTEQIINGLFDLGSFWLHSVPKHHVKSANGEWIGGFVHVLQYIEMQSQLEDDAEAKTALLNKFNALRDGAFDKILDYLKMDPIRLGDDKSFKNHLMFLSINAFEYIQNEWPQIKQLSINALDKLARVLNRKYEQEKWAESIGNVEVVKPFRSGLRQDDATVHGECEWYIMGDMKLPDVDKLELHCTGMGLDYNGLVDGENEEVYFDVELPCRMVYVYFLRAIACKVNDGFQEIIRNLFGDWVSSAKIKGDSRMHDKLDTNYKDKQIPKGAHILDVVRCLISCPTTQDVIAVYRKCCAAFTVVRVKNGFALDADVEFGYRTVFVNVLYESKDGKTRHICEIQITLDQVVHVRHYMHMFYKFRRAQEPENLL